LSDDHDHHPSPWGPHDWGHGAPHNSFAPLFLAMGVAIFLYFLAEAWSYGTYHPGYIPAILLGLAIVGFSMFIWWRQDISFDGSYEPLATGAPFRKVQIRKVAMWVFLMSEMMVFTSLFSTYMRYRQGIKNCETLFLEGEWIDGTVVTCFEPASHLIASSFWHIAPGAINTFALIISSFTIVQALRYAKMPNLDEEVRRKKVYRYLGSTWCLAVLFLTLKMIEWFIGFYVPEIDLGFIHIHEHDIVSLVNEGYTINADHYQHHNYVIDDHTLHAYELAGHDISNLEHYSNGAHMTANIRVSASLFYVTTGTHGAHVAGGIIGLSYMTYKAWKGLYTPQNAVSIEYFGLYWHFVDLVWVLVFPFFYLY